MTVNNRTSRVDYDNPHGFPVRMRIVVVGYDITSAVAVLVIKGPGSTRPDFYSSVATSHITKDLLDNAFEVLIPADDPVYSTIAEGKPYTWAFSVDDQFRVQGTYRSLKDTGPVSDSINEVTVNVGAVDIVTSVSTSGPAGPAGPVGPAGPWDASVTTIIANATLLPSAQTVFITTVYNPSIILILPSENDMYSGSPEEGTTKTINILRRTGDSPTDTVQLVGNSVDLPLMLYPGESVILQSLYYTLILFT